VARRRLRRVKDIEKAKKDGAQAAVDYAAKVEASSGVIATTNEVIDLSFD